MNHEVYQKIVQAITDAYESLAPEVIQYELKTSWLWLVVCVALTVISIVTLIVVNKRVKDKSKVIEFYDDTWATIVTVVCVISITLGVAFALAQIDDIYIATYFPEKMILRYVKWSIEDLHF